MTLVMQLWKNGYWITRAAETYAKHVFKDEWQAALAQRGDKLAIQNIMEAAETLKETKQLTGWELLAASAAEADKLAKPKRELLEKASKKIISNLQSGTYRAFGFDRPRTMDTQPVQLPKEAWSRVEKLDDTTILYQSLKFTDVRIRMASEAKDPIVIQALETQKVKVGRPSVAKDILTAFEVLNGLGQIDVTASMKSHFPKVRTWLEQSDLALAVPPQEISDKTLHRYFSKPFNDLKNSL